jgi:hypothetical protein
VPGLTRREVNLTAVQRGPSLYILSSPSPFQKSPVKPRVGSTDGRAVPPLWKLLETRAAHWGPVRKPWVTWGLDGRRFGDMGAEKADRYRRRSVENQRPCGPPRTAAHDPKEAFALTRRMWSGLVCLTSVLLLRIDVQ